MRSLLLVCVSVACGAADAELALAPQSFALGNRVDFVLSDGRHPFVDDDNRRALLALQLRGRGRLAILGFSGLAVERAVADTGETLQPTLPQESGACEDHQLRDDPAQTLFSLGLPPGAAPYRGLSELRGSVEVVLARGEPTSWDIALAQLAKDDDAAIDGHEALGLGLGDADNGQAAFRLSPEARLAVVELSFRDAAGKVIAVKPPRSDRREAKGARKRPPVGGREDVLLFNVALPNDAIVSVRFYPVLERQHLAFALDRLAFGVAVPDAASVRSAQRGADDL